MYRVFHDNVLGESLEGKYEWLPLMMFLVMFGCFGLVAYFSFSSTVEMGPTDTHRVAESQAPASKSAEMIRRNYKVALAPDAPDAQALIDALVQLGLDDAEVLAQNAEASERQFARLTKLGRAAIPAILQYLQVPEDLAFSALHDEGLLVHRSLRAGLIKALGQIEGHEADEALLGILLAASDPIEVALVAVQLERRNPGVYREQILDAATDSVKLAAQVREEIRGNPEVERQVADVAPAFELMRTLGDVEMMRTLGEELMVTAPSWTVYSKIALAKMPKGAGIDALSDMVITPDGELARRNLFALQMLAQESREYPEAGEALVELVTNYGSEIPTSTWRKIAWALQGNQYELSSLDGSGVEGALGTVNVESLNLTFVKRFYNPADWSIEQSAHRVALVDQLLADDDVTPEAVDALQRTRDFIEDGI